MRTLEFWPEGERLRRHTLVADVKWRVAEGVSALVGETKSPDLECGRCNNDWLMRDSHRTEPRVSQVESELIF